MPSRSHTVQRETWGKRGPLGIVRRAAYHAQGNPRALMTIAGELLAVAAQREARHIDEKLFLETCAPPATEIKAAAARRR
jgi:hypothetical protein